MWSVKTVPNESSLSLGFCFFTVARVILIGSLISSLVSRRCLPVSWFVFVSRRLEDDRLTVETEHLAIDVRDLAEAHVVLHGIDQHRHHVALLAARFGHLLDAALHPGAVARRVVAHDATNLLP